MLRPMPVSVSPLDDYRLNVVFDTGEKKVFDVKPYMSGEFFGQLADAAYFRSVHISPDGVVEWPDGQDISPDDLYFLSKEA